MPTVTECQRPLSNNKLLQNLLFVHFLEGGEFVTDIMLSTNNPFYCNRLIKNSILVWSTTSIVLHLPILLVEMLSAAAAAVAALEDEHDHTLHYCGHCHQHVLRRFFEILKLNIISGAE